MLEATLQLAGEVGMYGMSMDDLAQRAGVSKATIRPVFVDGTFVPRLMLPLSLSYDHRVVDGATGARFITHLNGSLADVRRLLL